MSFDKELELMQAIERIRELHKPRDIGDSNSGTYLVCDLCFDIMHSDGGYDNDFSETGKFIAYPCPTIKALDGEQKITQEEQRQALREIRQMEVELGMLDDEALDGDKS